MAAQGQWGERAECHKKDLYDPEDWVASGSPQRPGRVAYAIGICERRCPVRPDCAAYADESGQTFGVWGGVDLGYGEKPSERAMRKLRSVVKGASA